MCSSQLNKGLINKMQFDTWLFLLLSSCHLPYGKELVIEGCLSFQNRDLNQWRFHEKFPLLFVIYTFASYVVFVKSYSPAYRLFVVNHPFSVTFRGFYSYLKVHEGNKLKHKNILFLLLITISVDYFKGISYIKHIVKYQLWYITILFK